MYALIYIVVRILKFVSGHSIREGEKESRGEKQIDITDRAWSIRRWSLQQPFYSGMLLSL